MCVLLTMLLSSSIEKLISPVRFQLPSHVAERTVVDVERLPLNVAAVDATLEDTEVIDAAPDAEAARTDVCSVPDALAALALTEVAAAVDRDEVELRPVTEALVVLAETSAVADCKRTLGSKLVSWRDAGAYYR